MKCYVTKLQSSVNNDELPVFGKLRLSVNIPQGYSYSESSYIRFDTDVADKPVKLSIIGNGFFKASKDNGVTKDVYSTNDGKFLNLNFPHEIIPSPGNYIIEIESKYNLKYVILSINTGVDCFIAPISGGEVTCLSNAQLLILTNITTPNIYLANLCEGTQKVTNLNILGTSIDGDLSELNKYPLLQVAALGDEIKGDVSSLNECCSALKTITVGKNITGDIDALVVKCLAANPSLAAFNANTNGKVRVGGSTDMREYTVTYTITSTAIKLTSSNGVVQIATYDRASKKWDYES